jgi:phosphoribosyl-dephospho-CoA transferase
MTADRSRLRINSDVHTLLCIKADAADRLVDEHGCPRGPNESRHPNWVSESLRRAPWVVVRRVTHDSLFPVGIRGESRGQRFAAWVRPADICDHVVPQALASERAWKKSPRYAQIPVLTELDRVQDIMSALGLGEVWGPVGGVGFELASGRATVTLDSDLDLVIEVEQLLPPAAARALHAQLAALPVRTDVLLETPRGAVALAEYARTPDSFVLRTLEGPRLVDERPIAGRPISERAPGARPI